MAFISRTGVAAVNLVSETTARVVEGKELGALKKAARNAAQLHCDVTAAGVATIAVLNPYSGKETKYIGTRLHAVVQHSIGFQGTAEDRVDVSVNTPTGRHSVVVTEKWLWTGDELRDVRIAQSRVLVH